ncbi:unnamed protein product [Adineta steineri]|uniref:Tetratricopeptide repeat protein n=1 Tax=Adineta steineri TaxID=433720 RepID=A0A818SR66_9BILA|nr:unnamed protein product [Adineta steineri]CAF0876054.1 unnamed protein product [Adineta steineri]CAF3671351.1 unnamed protein product [Adineta steineri]
MCDMNEWNQSRKYLQYLLIHSNGQDLPWIEYFIGQTFYEIGQLNEARLCYDRAIKSIKINLQDSTVVLSVIGKVLYSQGKYDQALDFLQQTLEIREEYYEHFHVDIAISVDNISDLLIDQKKYDQALEYQTRAMSIFSNFILTGNVLSAQGKFDEALAIREKDLPYSYTTVVSNLMDIGRIKVNQGNFDGALDDFSRAVTLLHEYDPLNHSELTIGLEWIASI